MWSRGWPRWPCHGSRCLNLQKCEEIDSHRWEARVGFPEGSMTQDPGPLITHTTSLHLKITWQTPSTYKTARPFSPKFIWIHLPVFRIKFFRGGVYVSFSCVCVFTWMHVCTCMCMCLSVCIHVSACVCTYVYMHLSVCYCECMCVHMCVHVSECAFMGIHMWGGTLIASENLRSTRILAHTVPLIPAPRYPVCVPPHLALLPGLYRLNSDPLAVWQALNALRYLSTYECASPRLGTKLQTKSRRTIWSLFSVVCPVPPVNADTLAV